MYKWDKIAEIIHFVVISMQSYNFISLFALTSKDSNLNFNLVLREKKRRAYQAGFSIDAALMKLAINQIPGLTSNQKERIINLQPSQRIK